MSIDRAAALAELSDATTPAARLQELALAHPELGQQIAAHPNVYPALLEWIAVHAASAASAAGAGDPDAAAAPDAVNAVGANAAIAAGADVEAVNAPKWVLPSVLGLGALVTVGAVVAAVALVPGLFPAEGSSEPAPEEVAAAAHPPARDYLLGAEITWTMPAVPGAEISVEKRGDIFVAASDDVWVTAWQLGDFHSHRMVALNPDSGDVLWSRDTPRLDCAAFALDDLIYCVQTESSELMVIDLASGDDATSPLTGRAASGVHVTADSVLVAHAIAVGGGFQVSATAFDSHGQEVWNHEAQCPADWASPDGAYSFFWDTGEEFILVGPCYHALMDPTTGTVLDATTGGGIGGPDHGEPVGEVWLTTERGSLVASGRSDFEQRWRMRIDGLSDFARAYATSPNPSSAIAVLDFETGEVTRVNAALAPTRVDSMPRELPDCPEGWTPVGWSEWKGGATLICQAGDASVTVFLVEKKESTRSTSAEATPTGYRATFDGVEVEIGLDGWVVWINGAPQPVRDGWTPSTGGTEYIEVEGLESCPAGTFPLSLSVWRGGWLLTCGVTTFAPTRFVYEVDGTRGSGGALEFARGRYCGTNDDGRLVCVSSSPALVQFGTGTDLEQHSVGANFFAGSGSGGAGQGTGAYGVDTPADTPQDQVGYFVAILEKSAAARSQVNSVLAPLNACSVTNADVQALRVLTQARTDLLTALATTPVDLVPDGANLLAHLTSALELSEAADIGYVNAGLQMAGGDCSGGRVTYRNAIAVADQAEAAKVAFVNAWNAHIPAEFGVRTFTARDI